MKQWRRKFRAQVLERQWVDAGLGLAVLAGALILVLGTAVSWSAVAIGMTRVGDCEPCWERREIAEVLVFSVCWTIAARWLMPGYREVRYAWGCMVGVLGRVPGEREKEG